jgi:hypothetical protein
MLRLVERVVRDQDVAIQIDAHHFFVDRKRTTTFFSTVLVALKETFSPDFVLKWTLVGFVTVRVATNLRSSHFAMSLC